MLCHATSFHHSSGMHYLSLQLFVACCSLLCKLRLQILGVSQGPPMAGSTYILQ